MAALGDLLSSATYRPPPAGDRSVCVFCPICAQGVAKLVLIMLVVAGGNPFQMLNQATPQWWNWMQENKIYGCMMLFFVCNFFETNLISTGAFEIQFNDVPVWSKLETGRIPNPPELVQIIENQIRWSSHGAGGLSSVGGV